MLRTSQLVPTFGKGYFSPYNWKALLLIFGATSLGVIFTIYKKRISSNKAPKKWRLVGEISDIFCYPVKSCAPIRITENIQCSNVGLLNGVLRERVFVIVSESYAPLSSNPKLLLIHPQIVDNTLILTAPSMPDFLLNISQLHKITDTIIHSKHPNGTVDCGSDIAIWLSTYISGKSDGNRMVFYPDTESTRNYRINHLRQKDIGFTQIKDEFNGFMMINAESVKQLNTRIDHDVSPLQFRPNFVVNGAIAYDEDNWKWVRIGDNVIFKYTGPCLRCRVVTMNPANGEVHKQQEPLKTLKSYRCFETCKDPVMGIYLLSQSSGYIGIGDAVYVGNDR